MHLQRAGLLLISFAWFCGVVAPGGANAQDLSSIEIPYEKHVLDNGLTLLIHEDHSSPQVFVSVYYRVGSRDESPGKTGFAHLFEHLMFNGSENYPDGASAPIQEVGGNLNGDTWFDRTRYYQTVPSTALDRVLWLESDRMGHLLGAITQEKLDQQRGVVQNEKRRGDNRPYAMTQYNMLKGVFPEGHPYRWTTIGSMEDLEAASLDDVHAWFKEYYGAANALLIVAGDVESTAVLDSVKRHFGDIPAGPAVSRLDDWVPRRTTNTTEIMQDMAANPAIMRSWPAPGRDRAEYQYLDLASQILGGGESSRLHKALVKDAGLATGARVLPRGHGLASMPFLNVTLLPEADQDLAQEIIDAEFARFFRDGPTKEELSLAKTSSAANKIRSLDSLRDRAVLLIESEFYLGSPEAYKEQFGTYDSATREDVRLASSKWLDDGYHQILVEPFGGHKVSEDGVDRSRLPDVTNFPDVSAPRVSDHVLSNGINVRFVERPGIPAVTIAARFAGGLAIEDAQGVEVPSLTLKMLAKGAGKRDAEQVQRDLKATGSLLQTAISKDDSVVTLSTLSSTLDEAIGILADAVQSPAFDASEIEILRTAELASIEAEKSAPATLARRYLKWFAYGEAHPYGARPSRSESISAITEDDLLGFHRSAYRPENLTIFAVGGVEENMLLDALEESFGSWRPEGDASQPSAAIDEIPTGEPRVILFDAPSAPQSNIIAFQAVSPPYGEQHDAFEIANWIYGGSFTSRINTNLRQEKGWSYGVRSATNEALGSRIWSISAQVQTDKTAASIVELRNELAAVSESSPFTQDELDDVRNLAVRGQAGRLSNSSQVLEYIMSVTANGQPDNYIESRKATLDELELPDLQAAFDEHVDMESLAWIIVGDLSAIEPEVRELGLGRVEVWSADAERLR